MAFIASDSGSSDFKKVPPGAYIGRCYSLIDLGTQAGKGQADGKFQHKIKIGWELFGEDEEGNSLTVDVNGTQMPMTIHKKYTVSLHEKANLRHDLASWRGRDFTDEEAKAFDVAKLLGAYCMINATTSETNGKTYTNVAGITPIPGALKNSKPAAVHAPVVFDLDKPDMAVFSTFYEKLQAEIKLSPEWAQSQRKNTQGSGFEDMPSDGADCPF